MEKDQSMERQHISYQHVSVDEYLNKSRPTQIFQYSIGKPEIQQLQHQTYQINNRVYHSRPQPDQIIINAVPSRDIEYQNYERPMTLNAWTQTQSDDFPKLTLLNNTDSEEMLLAKIKNLEESIKAQDEVIKNLKGRNHRTPSPAQVVPNSTTSTPTSIKHEGTRYRILAQSEEPTSEAQIEIEISDEVIAQNLNCSNDSDRLEICLSDENDASPKTPAEIKPNPERPDLVNATVSIGPNGTRIPVWAYEKMSWKSASLATRKLLTLIFDRETLATHSMTGKASPAFKDFDKPTKGKLEPSAVQDIIFIVSKKCGVSPKEVRTAITTKCADENKMIKLKALKNLNLQDSKRMALRELNRSKSDKIND